MAGVVAYFAQEGNLPMALYVLLAFHAYLRPGEASALKAREVLSPLSGTTGALGFWSVMVAPSEDLVPSKTKTFDDTIVLDQFDENPSR